MPQYILISGAPRIFVRICTKILDQLQLKFIMLYRKYLFASICAYHVYAVG
jgi:hypothetical protein